MPERASASSSLTVTYALMLIGVLMWGGNWVATKIAVDAVPPLTLAMLRYLAATPLILIWLRTQGPLPTVERQDLKRLLVMGMLFVIGSNLFFVYGLRFAPTVDGAIIYPGMQPLFAGIVAALLLGEALALRQFAGFGVALVGLVLVVGGGQVTLGGGAARLLGDLLYLFGALVWAYSNVLMREVGQRLSAVAATGYSALMMLPALIALAIWEGEWETAWQAIPLAWPALAYVLFISTGPPTIFFYNGIRRLGVARAAAFSYLVPVSGVVMTTIFLGEHLLLVQAVGGALVLLGLWLVSGRARASRTTSTAAVAQESRP